MFINMTPVWLQAPVSCIHCTVPEVKVMLERIISVNVTYSI